MVAQSISSRTALVVLGILTAACVTFADHRDAGRRRPITSEQNTKLSDLLHRLSLVETAGNKPHTGQFFVKIYRVPQGEECDVDGDLCTGRDLVVSVASLDMYGDHALYRVTNLVDWRFVEWKAFAAYDTPDNFTSFVVEVTPKPGAGLLECRNRPPTADRYVTIEVNPWKVTCVYGR